MEHIMVVWGYAIPTGIPCVDGLSTGPLGFGMSYDVQLKYVKK